MLCDYGFEVDGARIKYGRGVLAELGEAAVMFGMKRAAVFVDPFLRDGAFVHTALDRLRDAGIDVAIYTEIEFEPTDRSFKKAAAFAVDGKFDGFISIGGGSTMDTAKAADLYATYPAPFMDYVNAPIGGGKPVPGPLKPHIACPTTSGTGSECTGDRDLRLSRDARKDRYPCARIASDARHHRSRCHAHVTAMVVACSGFDVLSHALESYTALPYTQHPRPERASPVRSIKARIPYSDIGCIGALAILGDAHRARGQRSRATTKRANA